MLYGSPSPLLKVIGFYLLDGFKMIQNPQAQQQKVYITKIITKIVLFFFFQKADLKLLGFRPRLNLLLSLLHRLNYSTVLSNVASVVGRSTQFFMSLSLSCRFAFWNNLFSVSRLKALLFIL